MGGREEHTISAFSLTCWMFRKDMVRLLPKSCSAAALLITNASFDLPGPVLGLDLDLEILSGALE